MPNKAIAAGGTAAVAGAITSLIISIWWKNAPPDAAAGITTLINAVLSFAAAWMTPMEK